MQYGQNLRSIDVFVLEEWLNFWIDVQNKKLELSVRTVLPAKGLSSEHVLPYVVRT